MTIQERCVDVAGDYLKRMGLEIQEGLDNKAFSIVAKDDDEILHLVDVSFWNPSERDVFEQRASLTPKEEQETERNIIDFIVANSEAVGNAVIWADRLDMLFVTATNVLLRWRTNVFGRDE